VSQQVCGQCVAHMAPRICRSWGFVAAFWDHLGLISGDAFGTLSPFPVRSFLPAAGTDQINEYRFVVFKMNDTPILGPTPKSISFGSNFPGSTISGRDRANGNCFKVGLKNYRKRTNKKQINIQRKIVW